MLNVVDKNTIPGEELIRRESRQAELRASLTPAQLELVYENQWFHLLVPQRLGGKEMALPAFARLMERLAFVDGSFAWNVNLGAGANMFSGFMEREEAARVFADRKACVAGSGARTGTARAFNGGFIIEGEWKYASGSAHATFFSLNAEVVGSEEQTYRSFLVPASKVEVFDSWKVFGMRATSSCNFRVDSVWVPASYCFDLQKPSPNFSSALYRFPFMLLAEINMLVMATGLASRFADLVQEALEEKGRWTARASALVEGSLADFSASRIRVYDLLDRIWVSVEQGQEIGGQGKEFRAAVLECAAASRRLVDQLYPYAGMKVLFEETDISRVFRDFKVASQHALLSPEGPV